MAQLDHYTEQAVEQARHLSERVGGRGSCTSTGRQAAEYTVARMRPLRVQDVRLEPYQGAPSTYRPYAQAFLAALLV